MPEGSFQ